MVLPTNLQHVETKDELKQLITNNENVMVCCGRMGPMCLPVYDIMRTLQDDADYKHILFRDMAFDSPEAIAIRNLPQCQGFMGLPFTIYYKNGEVVSATSGIQNKDQVLEQLEQNFKK